MDLTRPVAFMIIYDGNPQVNDDSPEMGTLNHHEAVFSKYKLNLKSHLVTIFT